MSKLKFTLALKQLACERDERVLFAGLDWCFSSGELVQILGPNGAGKTTLLRILAGLSQDFWGDIHWQGESVLKDRWEFANQLLYIGHQTGVKRMLTPLENLRWLASNTGIPATGSIDTIELSEAALVDALASVNLSGFEHTPCYKLSAGQNRRVALARLYLSKAAVWILDEPFTALDKAGIQKLEQRLQQHVEQGGLVLLTSHQDLQLPKVSVLDLQAFARPPALTGVTL